MRERMAMSVPQIILQDEMQPRRHTAETDTKRRKTHSQFSVFAIQ